VHDFKNWLAGVGYSSDYVKGGIALKHVGQGRPVSAHPSVISYLDRSTSRVLEYEKQLQLLKLRMGRTTPGSPPSLEDCFRYFKYIVRGEPYDPADWPTVEDAVSNKDQPVVNPNKRARAEDPSTFVPSDQQLALSFGEKRSRKDIDDGWEGRPRADGPDVGCDVKQEEDNVEVAGAEADIDAEENSDSSESSKEDAEQAEAEIKQEPVEGPEDDGMKDEDDDETEPIAKPASAAPAAAVAKQQQQAAAATTQAASAIKQAAEDLSSAIERSVMQSGGPPAAASPAAPVAPVPASAMAAAPPPPPPVAAAAAAPAAPPAAVPSTVTPEMWQTMRQNAARMAHQMNLPSNAPAPPAPAAPPAAKQSAPVAEAPPEPDASPVNAPATPANERLLDMIAGVAEANRSGYKASLDQKLQEASRGDAQLLAAWKEEIDHMKVLAEHDAELAEELRDAGEVLLMYDFFYIDKITHDNRPNKPPPPSNRNVRITSTPQQSSAPRKSLAQIERLEKQRYEKAEAKRKTQGKKPYDWQA
jgi:hypothetical protein